MAAPERPAPRTWVDRGLALVGLQRALPPASTPRRPATGGRVFQAAQVNRLTVNEFASLLSANDELQNDLARLRGMARRLTRDTSLGARYPRLMSEQVIGADGIRLQARIERRIGGLNRGINRKLEEEFTAWGEPGTCTVDGRTSWLDVQTIAVESLSTDGEFLVRHIRGADNAWGYALELLDPDLLDHTFTGLWPNGNRVVMGVEVDRWHRPVAYHMWQEHPSAITGRSKPRARVLAADIEHLFLVRRPQQTRGVPPAAPILLDANTLAAFLEAAVNAARVGASRMAAIERDKDASVDDDWEPTPVPDEVAPAQMLDLEPGAKLNAPHWQYPTGEMDPFTRVIERHNAIGLNVFPAGLTGDLSGANYSSMRYGALFEREGWRRLQRFVIQRLCWPVYRQWYTAAAVMGRIPARATMADYDRVLWQPRGYEGVDPAKESKANDDALRNRLTSRRRILAAQGVNLEELLEELVEEELLMTTLGLKTAASATAPADAPVDAPVDAPDDSDAADTEDDMDDDTEDDDAPAGGARRAQHPPRPMRRIA